MYSKLSSEEITKLQNGTKKIYSRYFVILYEESSTSKFAFIASKKVGNAVIRNQSKRYLREIIRLNHLTISKKYILVICKKNINEALHSGRNYFDFEKDLLLALKKV
ncbi:MAG: ribonuclease P protein component [Fusobacteria bacterium]|nr:ribonuclease P protein component [Fusobacteriota bacterium]